MGPTDWARTFSRCPLRTRTGIQEGREEAYVDFVVTTPDNRLVFLEVDEMQHSYESQLCETTRMWNICESITLADLGGDIHILQVWKQGSASPARKSQSYGAMLQSSSARCNMQKPEWQWTLWL